MTMLTEQAIAAALTDHPVWEASVVDRRRVFSCACGHEFPMKSNDYDEAWEQLAEHQASVVWGLIEANTTEEWGTRDRNGHTRTHFFKANADEWAELDHRDVVSRRVTGWEEA
jgi:hypothetical protein